MDSSVPILPSCALNALRSLHLLKTPCPSFSERRHNGWWHEKHWILHNCSRILHDCSRVVKMMTMVTLVAPSGEKRTSKHIGQDVNSTFSADWPVLCVCWKQSVWCCALAWNSISVAVLNQLYCFHSCIHLYTSKLPFKEILMRNLDTLHPFPPLSLNIWTAPQDLVPICHQAEFKQNWPHHNFTSFVIVVFSLSKIKYQYSLPKCVDQRMTTFFLK